jgi:hypothetical protein
MCWLREELRSLRCEVPADGYEKNSFSELRDPEVLSIQLSMLDVVAYPVELIANAIQDGSSVRILHARENPDVLHDDNGRCEVFCDA